MLAGLAPAGGKTGGRPPPAGAPHPAAAPAGRRASAERPGPDGVAVDRPLDRHHARHHEAGDGEAGAAPAGLDPLSRHLAFDRPPGAGAPPAAAAPAAPPANASLVHVEQLVARLVRRVAWGGDGRRGAARIELGAGELAGATITVEACGRELHVDIDLPPGAAADVWRNRIATRLRARGFDLASIDVR